MLPMKVNYLKNMTNKCILTENVVVLSLSEILENIADSSEQLVMFASKQLYLILCTMTVRNTRD